MDDISTYTLENGAQVSVCKFHQLEFCHDCGYLFTDTNQMAIAEANKRQASAKHQKGDDLGPGKLRVGTEVRMTDRSGMNPNPMHIDGKICAVIEDQDEESEFHGETCYVIKLCDDDSLMNFPVDSVHREWLLKVDGRYVAASEVLDLTSS